jgi:hypothetical protein
MASKAKALPTGWTAILDEVQARLDQSLASANARMDTAPANDHACRAPTHKLEIDQWNERLRRLGMFLEAADQIVQSVDEALQKEEAHWREQLTLCESLRQKAS